MGIANSGLVGLAGQYIPGIAQAFFLDPENTSVEIAYLYIEVGIRFMCIVVQKCPVSVRQLNQFA